MKDRLLSLYTRFRCREEGQTMVEYALIVGLVSIVAIALLTTIGTDVKGVFSKIVTALESV